MVEFATQTLLLLEYSAGGLVLSDLPTQGILEIMSNQGLKMLKKRIDYGLE